MKVASTFYGELPMITPHVRFAPSPTGALHLGHAYSALYSWHACGQNPSFFHLRIDDLDHTRCKSHFVDAQIADLHWLGISWTHPPHKQSDRLARYQAALSSLKQRDLIYPCYLTRREVNEILSAPQETTDLKDALSESEKTARSEKGDVPAWRLDMAKIATITPPLYWQDAQKGTQQVCLDSLDDIIIARRDIGASYDLSVVLDDFDTDISLVTRGDDLFAQTNIHRLLQHLLSLPTPLYDHHQLIRDQQGKRLAKRDNAMSLTHLRDTGYSRADILDLLPSFGNKIAKK